MLLGDGHTESSYDKEIKETKGVVFCKVKKREWPRFKKLIYEDHMLTEL